MAKKAKKNGKKRKLHVRTGDNVVMVAGNDLGATGRILRTIPDENKVVVEDVNVHFVHEKPGRAGRRQGERIEKEMPVDASNVMLVCRNRDCGSHGKPVRVRRRKGQDGNTMRLCVKCEQPVGE